MLADEVIKNSFQCHLRTEDTKMMINHLKFQLKDNHVGKQKCTETWDINLETLAKESANKRGKLGVGGSLDCTPERHQQIWNFSKAPCHRHRCSCTHLTASLTKAGQPRPGRQSPANAELCMGAWLNTNRTLPSINTFRIRSLTVLTCP